MWIKNKRCMRDRHKFYNDREIRNRETDKKTYRQTIKTKGKETDIEIDKEAGRDIDAQTN